MHVPGSVVGTGKGGWSGGRLESGRLKRELEPESWVLGHHIETACLPRNSLSPRFLSHSWGQDPGLWSLCCLCALAVIPSRDEEVVWDQHSNYCPMPRPVRTGTFLGTLEQSHLLSPHNQMKTEAEITGFSESLCLWFQFSEGSERTAPARQEASMQAARPCPHWSPNTATAGWASSPPRPQGDLTERSTSFASQMQFLRRL